MPLLVTGSIAIDTVKTPFGVSRDCVGGSAVYFAMAASYFCPVRLVGVVGEDCPFDLTKVFAGRDVDLRGLEVRRQSKTFRWHGTYQEDMNQRTTDYIELNVLAEAPPVMPEVFRDSRFVFLANTAPKLQHQLLDELDQPVFVAADTMDLWIDGERDQLEALLRRIDCLIINEDEARLLAGRTSLVEAAQRILEMGTKYVVVKKGESGSLMCGPAGEIFVLPAYPATDVKDPTGAGDSFAGALLGSLAETGEVSAAQLRRAIAYGTVVASFAIMGFSLEGLASLSRKQIDERLSRLRELTSF